MEPYLHKPNEYFMLRRAARHLLIGLWRGDNFWGFPDRMLDIFDAVTILRDAALTIPETLGTRRTRWLNFHW